MTTADEVLQSTLLGNKTAISYQSLAYLANVPYNTAKTLLFDFYETHKSQLIALFSVSGVFLKNGLPTYSFRIATAENLDHVKSSMVSVSGIHIHTLAPQLEEGSDPAVIARLVSDAVVSSFSLQMQQYNQVPTISSNAFRSNEYSAVKFHIERRENAYSAAVISSPPPAVVRDVFSPVNGEKQSAPKRTITDAFKKAASSSSSFSSATKESDAPAQTPVTHTPATATVMKPKPTNSAMSAFMKVDKSEKNDLFAEREDPFAKPARSIFNVVNKSEEPRKEKKKSMLDSMYDDDSDNSAPDEEEEEAEEKSKKTSKRKSVGRPPSRRLVDEEEEEAMALAYAQKEEMQKEVDAQVAEEAESAKQQSNLGRFLQGAAPQSHKPASHGGAKRRVMRKEEVIDDEGFLVTRMVEVEEDADDGEDVMEAPKATTPKNSPAKDEASAPAKVSTTTRKPAETAKVERKSSSVKDKVAEPVAEAPKKPAGNILSFFKKK